MTVERRDEDGITMITDLTSDDWNLEATSFAFGPQPSNLPSSR